MLFDIGVKFHEFKIVGKWNENFSTFLRYRLHAENASKIRLLFSKHLCCEHCFSGFVNAGTWNNKIIFMMQINN